MSPGCSGAEWPHRFCGEDSLWQDSFLLKAARQLVRSALLSVLVSVFTGCGYVSTPYVMAYTLPPSLAQAFAGK